jgi:hypothetical protein
MITDSHAAVKVHAVNTDRWVVFDTQIDVFADTKAEVASFRKVSLSQFVLLNLEATFKNFLSLWSTDSNMDSNLFVTTDTECSNSVAGLACNAMLVRY